MATKRTEEYEYKLAQDIHLKHVYGSKPKVETSISPATSRTLQLGHSPNHQHNRDVPSLAQHQIDFDNHRIIKRIMSISERRNSSSGYARYNEF